MAGIENTICNKVIFKCRTRLAMLVIYFDKVTKEKEASQI
jgi:hypothetical protein